MWSCSSLVVLNVSVCSTTAVVEHLGHTGAINTNFEYICLTVGSHFDLRKTWQSCVSFLV